MIRLHHMQAKKYFLAGRTVALCPCKLCPGKPWHPECWVNLDMDEGRHEPEYAWTLIKKKHLDFIIVPVTRQGTISRIGLKKRKLVIVELIGARHGVLFLISPIVKGGHHG